MVGGTEQDGRRANRRSQLPMLASLARSMADYGTRQDKQAFP